MQVRAGERDRDYAAIGGKLRGRYAIVRHRRLSGLCAAARAGNCCGQLFRERRSVQTVTEVVGHSVRSGIFRELDFRTAGDIRAFRINGSQHSLVCAPIELRTIRQVRSGKGQHCLAARRGQRRGICREPEVGHRRGGLRAALPDRHIDLPVVRDGQRVNAVFIGFRVEFRLTVLRTAAISDDNCGRPFFGVQRDHRAPEIAVLIKLGIGNMVFHIVLYIVLMIAVPVVPEACPVRILAFAGNPKLVLVRAEVVEIDLNAVSRFMRNQIGMWRQSKAHTGCECCVCGCECGRLILVFIKETVHDEKPSAGLSCLAAQECLHKGIACGKFRIQFIQDIYLICQICAFQHPAERGSLCSR